MARGDVGVGNVPRGGSCRVSAESRQPPEFLGGQRADERGTRRFGPYGTASELRAVRAARAAAVASGILADALLLDELRANRRDSHV